jgi:AcrR family transcriptional regulator
MVGGEPKDRKEQILNEARSLFTRHGFRKCTTGDISSACGLTKAALYHYFESKEQIFSEVVHRESILLINQVREAIESVDSPIDRLRTFILTRFKAIKELLNLYRISQVTGRELIPVAEDSRNRFFKQESELLISILQEGIKKGEFRKVRVKLVARTVIAAFKGIESYFLLTEDEQTLTDAMEETLDIFCYGLAMEGGE